MARNATDNADTPVVLFMLWAANEYPQRVARGAHQYAQEHGRWQVLMTPPDISQLHTTARSLGRAPDGILGFLGTSQLDAAVADAGLPAVNVSAAQASSALTRVIPDNRAVGRLAANHLIDAGFEQLAFVGTGRFYSHERGAGFIEAAGRANHPVRSADYSDAALLDRWLATLSTPIGLLAATDNLGWKAIQLVTALGRRVPDDIAVIGVDDSDLLCQLSPVPLSSIDTAGQRVGYEAARLLDAMMQGQAPPDQPLLVPPGRLVERASTAIVTTDSPLVAEAARIIREQACDPISPDEVAAALGVARRTLERQMKDALGRTPHQEIRRNQFRHVEELLAGTQLSIDAIAKRCGFNDKRHFFRAFRQHYSITPGEFRRRTARGS